jgi:hypothetical protein
MRAIQTRPINGDPDFLAVRDSVNRLLAPFGFPMVARKGSISWLAGVGHPSRAMETFFKLLYVGRGKPYVLGIRRDFAESIPKLKAVQWLMEFVVMPATDVPFVGFNIAVGSADVATQRLEKILGTLPEPDSSLAISLEGDNDREFDLQLQNL